MYKKKNFPSSLRKLTNMSERRKTVLQWKQKKNPDYRRKRDKVFNFIYFAIILTAITDIFKLFNTELKK